MQYGEIFLILFQTSFLDRFSDYERYLLKKYVTIACVVAVSHS